jgi:hypothetical protein
MYERDGVEYVRKVGSRLEVWDGVCFCTSGGLQKDQLIKKNNKIVSKKRSEMGKRRFEEKNPFSGGGKGKKVTEAAVVEETIDKRDYVIALPTLKRRKRKRVSRQS